MSFEHSDAQKDEQAIQAAKKEEKPLDLAQHIFDTAVAMNKVIQLQITKGVK